MNNIYDDKKRNYNVDIIKGLAIFLVIFGHSIQYYSQRYNINFFSNPIFKFIYTFHMPLFMFISGYLFYLTINKYKALKIIQKKARELLIPLLSFCLIGFIFIIYNLEVKQGINDVYVYINNFTNLLFTGYWFIWILLLCSLTVTLVNKVFKDKILIYIILLVLTLLLPDGHLFFYYKYMLPYFLIGYYCNKLNIQFSFKWISFILLAAFFSLMFIYFKDNYYIYLSKMSLYSSDYLNQLWIIMYRYIIGFLGIALIFTLVNFFTSYFKKSTDFILKIFAYIGQYTLGIYLMSSIIFLYMFSLIPLSETHGLLKYCILIDLAFIIILICLNFFGLIKKNKLTYRLFLGK
jgi:fucose 4-O-acetylase-like acetyltransferase